MSIVLPVDDHFEVVVDPATGCDGVDFFNTLAFYNLHRPSSSNGFYFLLRNRTSGASAGAVHFCEAEPGHFRSPLRGSYAGFELARGTDIPLACMEKFEQAVEAFLASHGARRVSVSLPPLAYHPHTASVWINILLRAGFVIDRHELIYSLEVDGESFVSKIDRGNKKQLAKCERNGLAVRSLEREEYRAAYEVIVENRAKKGNAVSVSWSALDDMVQQCPLAVRCFGVFQDAKMIASSVCIAVNPDVLYVFYWGEVAGVETLSPVTLLARHLYEVCQNEKIALLDVGASTLEGVPNHGLIRYKKALGCTESLKLFFTKTIER